MNGQIHFQPAASWKEARRLVTFEPRRPRKTEGLRPKLRIHVRDHKRRLAPEDRTLEAYYGPFVLSQSCKGEAEAKRWALDVSFGADPRPATIAGRLGRVFELGPEVPPDDIDSRPPAVVAWHDGRCST